MAEKSKILIIGGTGYIGKFIVEASAKSGHPTFVLLRESTVSDPVKGQIVEGFKNSGVAVLIGDLYDHESLVKAIKQVDVVISAVGFQQLADQVKIVAAIKEAGNVKRRARGSRHLHLRCVPLLCWPPAVNAGATERTAPPRDKAVILGDGNPKAVFNVEQDIGTYTIKAVDDPRTLNKKSNPEANPGFETDLSIANLLLPRIAESPAPINFFLAINHSIFVKGDHTYFDITPYGFEASQLYPDVKYTTAEEYLEKFV
ncbi:UNVERIFIED_CONTAM: Isoflavone reductase-like protein [Sesamum calycinum]|uniref:Isoflavone reductase-like protein n=1 Tax=Sesamum calycinum TaxID=2727403 RepID=A0AAW2P6U7_9LAMI